MTDRQRAFLDHYLASRGKSATASASAAGYSWPGKQGARLCSFPELAAEILAARTGWQAEREAKWASRLAEAAEGRVRGSSNECDLGVVKACAPARPLG